MGKMSNEDKLKVYEKYKERKEEDIIKNTGETYTFGTTHITIRELAWCDADALEDKVLELFKEITGLLQTNVDDKDMLDNLKNVDIAGLLETFLTKVLRQGLIDLANIATNGEITMDKIRECKATKSEVIKIVVNALMLNYGYLKNLIPLAAFK